MQSKPHTDDALRPDPNHGEEQAEWGLHEKYLEAERQWLAQQAEQVKEW